MHFDFICLLDNIRNWKPLFLFSNQADATSSKAIQTVLEARIMLYKQFYRGHPVFGVHHEVLSPWSVYIQKD